MFKQFSLIGIVFIVLCIFGLIYFMIFGHFEKNISNESFFVGVLINKMEDLNRISAYCKFDSKGEVLECDGLSETLERIRGENEAIVFTEMRELVGVNFSHKVIVVLRPRRRDDGRIYFSCSVWPSQAKPRGCRSLREAKVYPIHPN